MFCKATSLPFARPLRIVLRQSVGMLAAAELFAVLPQAVGHIAQMPLGNFGGFARLLVCNCGKERAVMLDQGGARVVDDFGVHNVAARLPIKQIEQAA